MGFELRPLCCFLGRCFATWAVPHSFFALAFFQVGSCVFAGVRCRLEIYLCLPFAGYVYGLLVVMRSCWLSCLHGLYHDHLHLCLPSSWVTAVSPVFSSQYSWPCILECFWKTDFKNLHECYVSFLAVLGSELRAGCLLGRRSAAGGAAALCSARFGNSLAFCQAHLDHSPSTLRFLL
jgi:hypothetical protein